MVQAFLGQHGSHEVHLLGSGPTGPLFDCTCPGFKTRKKCKHVEYVKQRWDEEDGYVVPFSSTTRIPQPEDIASPEAWRMFLLENAPVVVL
jgi:hypothetical protein